MFGKEKSDDVKLQGVIPRAAQNIFARARQMTEDMKQQIEASGQADLHKVTVKCSYLEIYEEKVNDLLKEGNNDLKVHYSLDSKRGTWVEGLTETCVNSEEEIMQLIKNGDGVRHKAATAMNAESSRSHSVFLIELHQEFQTESRVSKLCLADLAGSEDVRRSKVEGDAFDEATAINKSLSALNQVLHKLSEGKADSSLFRASKLTMILSNALAGNSKTTLMIALSPASDSLQESISTLKFARRAKTIKNKVHNNSTRSAAELEALVSQLQAKVAKMQEYINVLEKFAKEHGMTDIEALKKEAGYDENMSAEELEAALQNSSAASGTKKSAAGGEKGWFSGWVCF